MLRQSLPRYIYDIRWLKVVEYVNACSLFSFNIFVCLTKADFSRDGERNIQHVLEILHGAAFSAAQLSGKVAAAARSNKAAGCC